MDMKIKKYPINKKKLFLEMVLVLFNKIEHHEPMRNSQILEIGEKKLKTLLSLKK